MKKILFLCLIGVSTLLHSQVKHDHNWSIGQGAIPDNTVDSGMDINFNTNPVSINSMWRDIDIEGTNTTMSDAEGNLLFYSNGCKVFNADHELMENGNNINAGEVNDIQCPDDQESGAYNSFSNGMLSLPAPESDSLYYLFHQRLIYLDPDNEVKIDRLLYSVINMNSNDGKGAVIEKDIPIIEDTLWRGNLTAVRHANGLGWWVVNFQNLSDSCYTVLLRSDTILGPYKQQVGLAPTGGSDTGQSCFSPDGTKYARYNRVDQLYLYDFDRTTGLFSNFEHIILADTVYSGGVSFSPNSRYLYASTLFELYQMDVLSTDIASSKTLVGTYDGYFDPFPTYLYRMQLGPDCRIYMHSGSGHFSWNVINRPDEPGFACDLRQHSFELPYSNFRAMPYFPNYRLGVTPTYPCDSTIVVNLTTSTTTIPQAKTEVKLYPNPVKAGSDIIVELQRGVDGKLLLYDLLGQLVLLQELVNGDAVVKLRLPVGIESGIYFYALEGEEGRVATGKVVVE